MSAALAVGMLVVLKDAPGRPTGTIEKINSRSAWVWWHRNGETTKQKLAELKSIHSGPDTEDY